MKFRTLLQICFLFISCLLLIWFCAPPLTEDQARAHAIDKLEKYCEDFGIDMGLVNKSYDGLGSPENGYSFEWVADLPKEGQTSIDIWVSPSGEIVLTTEPANVCVASDPRGREM